MNSYGPRIITDGLVLCLDAADKNSYPGNGTTWSDLSGNGNNGTLINGPAFNSSNLGSLVFDGSNDYVSISPSSSLQITTEVTVTSIFKPTSFGANKQRLIDTNTSAGTNSSGSMIGLKIGTIFPYNDISWFINDSITYHQVRRSTQVITSTSVPYVVTARWRKSDGSASIFVNGAETSYAGSVTFTGNPGTLTNPITIGFLAGYGIYGNQTVYSTQIYNRYLTDKEIKQNYKATKGRFGL